MRISDWSSDVCSSDLLVAAPFRPAGVHALQHPGPVLAFGATSARIALDIGVVRVGLARQQRGPLVLVSPLLQRRKRTHAVVRSEARAVGNEVAGQCGDLAPPVHTTKPQGK